MASTPAKIASTGNSRGSVLAVLAIATVLVAICIGIAAYTLGTASTQPGLSDLYRFFPLAANAGCLLLIFSLFAGSTWHLLRDSKRLRVENVNLARLALVAAKTDNAAFVTNPDGNIQWVNDGFVRLTGHSFNEAQGKQPAPLLLGQLQNIKVTQKIRDGITHRRIFTVEMLCSNRRGHRFWMSLNMTPVVDEHGHLNHFIGIGSDITARRKAEDEVAKVGRRSELLLNAADDGILGFDLQGTISFANTSATRMTGFTTDEVIGQPLSTIIHQLRVSRGNVLQDELFAGAAFIDGSVQIGDTDEFRRKDGSSFTVEYTSTPVYEGNNLIGSVVVFRDVTERAQSEAIRTRQMRQAALRADVAFGLTNGDSLRAFLGRAMLCLVKHLDGAFARVWTLSPQDNMLELQASAGIYSHINGQHSRIPVGTLKVGKIAREGTPQISDNLLADPDILDKAWIARDRMVAFIGFPLFLEGNLIGVMAMYSRNRLPADAMEMFGCVSDSIAQGIVRKQAEESGLRQAAILDKTTDAIIVIGLDDRILFSNAAADRLYGWNGANQIGQPGADLIAPNKTSFERAKAFTLQQGEWRDEFNTIRRDDHEIPVDSRWSLVTDDGGATQRIIIVQTETTIRRQLESQLLASQRSETIGILAGGLAHQLTDTLAPILISAETLKARNADEQAGAALALVENNIRRSLELVRQVLTLSDPAEGVSSPLQPVQLIETVATIVRGTFPKTIQCRTDVQENLWVINADPIKIQQALLNLALHARAQMPEGGILTIAAQNAYAQEGDALLPNTAETGYYIRFTVEHTGAGLTDEVVAQLVHQTGRPGLSAGDSEHALQSAIGILREHRGFVTAGAHAGAGTSISAFLPAQEPAGGLVEEPKKPGLLIGNGELILLVDDEVSLLAITKEALETFGYRAITARDGAEAVAAYSAHRQEIRAVITDMLMPNMDGPSTIRVLRKLDPAVRIIASSGMLEPAKVRELTGLDDLAFLEKPYTADALLSSLHRVIHHAA